MMSDKKLTVLGIVAALMVVLTAGQSYLSKMKAPSKAPGGDTYLIQGLDPGRIAFIEVGKGENPVRLVRKGNLFLVANKENYRALTSKINDLLTSCLDIRTVELVTSNPANHESLHVTQEKAQNVVKFLGEDEKIITGLVIGTSRLPELQMDKRSTYVRLITSDDVYEAKNVPLPGASATDYMEKQIVDLGSDDVVRVTVTGPEDSYTLRVSDSNDDSIVMENIPEGKKLKTVEAQPLFSALSYFSFDDVKKAGSLEGGVNFDSTHVCELKDGTVYTFRIAEAADKTYVKCSAEYAGDTRAEILASNEELKDKEAKLLAHDRVLEFAIMHEGWVYEISNWNAEKLTKKLTDLLEDVEEEAKPEAQGDEVSSEQGEATGSGQAAE
ncbi:MAG: DUF4340 domain-containing protein [Planctomycetota bacterium]|jgi:hypothetical protein